MIKISNTILLIFMMSFVALGEVPQETPKEIIGQVNQKKIYMTIEVKE